MVEKSGITGISIAFSPSLAIPQKILRHGIAKDYLRRMRSDQKLRENIAFFLV